MLRLGQELTTAVGDHACEVVGLAHNGGEGRPHERRRGLVHGRHETLPQDLERDGVERVGSFRRSIIHRVFCPRRSTQPTVTMMLPLASTCALQLGGSNNVDSGSSTSAGPLTTAPMPSRLRSYTVASAKPPSAPKYAARLPFCALSIVAVDAGRDRRSALPAGASTETRMLISSAAPFGGVRV